MGEPKLMKLRGRRSMAIQRNALEAAAQVAAERAAVCHRVEAECAEKYPLDKLGAATERSARMEAEYIADRIKAMIKAGEDAGGDP